MESVNPPPAAGLQRNVVDAGRLLAVRQLASGSGSMPNVAARVEISEQRVVERDRIVIAQHRELDVTDTRRRIPPPGWRASVDHKTARRGRTRRTRTS